MKCQFITKQPLAQCNAQASCDAGHLEVCHEHLEELEKLGNAHPSEVLRAIQRFMQMRRIGVALIEKD